MKYKRIKKYFHFTSRSNSYKLIEICSKFYFCLRKENKGFETVKWCIAKNSSSKNDNNFVEGLGYFPQLGLSNIWS